MFRLFDIIILVSALLTVAFSAFLWIQELQIQALFVGIFSLIVLGFGIYFKLLRIVHFVLYRNFNKEETDH